MDKREVYVKAYSRYIDQFSSLESTFFPPIIYKTFKWKDSFTEEIKVKYIINKLMEMS